VNRDQYTELSRQLCNLVNSRRIQVGKEPLREKHIMRAVRLVIGPLPRERYPYIDKQAWFWDEPVPYTITRRGLNYLIANQEPDAPR
jgi:hypothetical protein